MASNNNHQEDSNESKKRSLKLENTLKKNTTPKQRSKRKSPYSVLKEKYTLALQQQKIAEKNNLTLIERLKEIEDKIGTIKLLIRKVFPKGEKIGIKFLIMNFRKIITLIQDIRSVISK